MYKNAGPSGALLYTPITYEYALNCPRALVDAHKAWCSVGWIATSHQSLEAHLKTSVSIGCLSRMHFGLVSCGLTLRVVTLWISAEFLRLLDVR